MTSCDKHFAVGQQRRRVIMRAVARLPVAVQVPLAGSYSSALAKVVESLSPAYNEHLAVGQQRRRVTADVRWLRLPVVVQVPLAGSYSSALARMPQRACFYRLRRAPCRWAATSPCESSRAVARLPVAVQVPLAGSYSSALARLCPPKYSIRQKILLRQAPCRWAATSPCDYSVRSRGCRSPSRSRSPDRIVPRSQWSTIRPCPPAASTLPLANKVNVRPV